VAKIKLSNVKCGGCFSSISQMIYLEDIIHLDMDHINKVATIRYENDHSIVKNIVDRINQSKFKAELIFEEIE
jgi:copper chaperone CopZ